MRARSVVCCLAFTLAACATGGTPHAGGSHDPNSITAEEVENSHEANAYDVVRALRPNMLVSRGHTTFMNSDPGIVVFLNGTQFGDLQSLRRITAKDIEQIHFYSASESSLRHGTGYPSGVIEVTTK